MRTSATLKAWHQELRRQGDKILSAPPSQYEIPDGKRLLATSRRVLDRVLTLEDGSKPGRGRVLDRLLRERAVTIGDFEQGKLPVVLEVPGRGDAEPRVREIAGIAGVAHVDVVFSHFEDSLPEPEGRLRGRAGDSP